jgi:hypothetical protein
MLSTRPYVFLRAFPISSALYPTVQYAEQARRMQLGHPLDLLPVL